MIDCGNSEIRELLPDMLHDTLAPGDRERVAVHMSTCAACAEEFALLARVYALGEGRAVNVSAIAGSIAPYRRRSWMAVAPLVRIAAGIAIIAVGGTSYIVSRTIGEGDAGINESAVVSLANDSTFPVTSVGAEPLTVSSDLSALDEQAVQELLAQLEKLDAAIPVEPRPVVRSLRVSGSQQ